MELYLQIALSFPTVVFTVLLGVMLGYWLIAMLGLVEFDAFDFSLAVDGDAPVGGFTGMMLKFGLDGVPLTVILTGIALFGWMISFFADYLLLRALPFDTLRYVYGGGVMLGALFAAMPLTGLMLRPLQQLFVKLKPVDSVSLLGRSAIVRSPEVSLSQGTASLEDGGAGLILQVRAEPGQFRRGDTVVLVEYIDAQNAYRVIADQAAVPVAPATPL